MLGHARFERGDARPLLLDDREQMDNPLAHDERGLLPAGGIKRYPYWQWERSGYGIPLCHTTGGVVSPQREKLSCHARCPWG